MVGPDICGFGGNTTEELCARWFQMAAIYPFARSHSDYWSDPQEPYSMGNTVLASALTNLKLRYAILRQLFWGLNYFGGLGYAFFESLALYP